MKGVKQKFAVLQKRYKLPSFPILDAEFELGKIDTDASLLAEIRRKITEKLHDATSALEEVLQPDTNLVDLYESRIFDEAEKQNLFELYKRLMVANRRSLELSIEASEKLDADFIKTFSAEWQKLKPQILKFFRTLRESWEKETEEGEAAGYMG